MPSTLIRTVLLYLTVVTAMKIMGKRQIGQMQLSEFVTVTILSELACFAILDTDIPIIYSIASIFVLICIEVTISFISVKSRFISRLFDGNPAYIIYNGKLDRHELLASRLTMTEVISEIRAAGISSVSQVNYMILEPSGKISVIPKAAHQPLTPSVCRLMPSEEGIDHALIFDGKRIPDGLSAVGRDDSWLTGKLSVLGISEKDVFYFAVDDSGGLTVIGMDGKFLPV